MTAAETVAGYMYAFGVRSLGKAEEVFTVVATKNVTHASTSPVNIPLLALAFVFAGLTAPAGIEQVATVFTTHTPDELNNLNPFP